MRTSGILLHITSLPSPGGIGSLGEEAFAFADFLQASGIRIWQVLPVGPTGYGESPYQSSSVYAGNPLLISCRTLREEGLLSYSDDEEYQPADPEKIDYEEVRRNKEMLLRRAFSQSFSALADRIEEFRASSDWIDDFALFTAVKNHFNQVALVKWPDPDIRLRRPDALRKYRELLRDEINYHVFCQYLFRRQWLALKKYCNERSVLLFGDMPIYVAADSADVWTHPEIFQLDRDLNPKHVAGVPPDYFSADGQLWGNPLYRWMYLRLFRRYDWWVDRLKHMSEMYDMLRIDHFVGFANYYSVRNGMPNARKGKWVIGPGKALFKTVRRALPNLKIIAEDLGCVNRRVRRLLDWCCYPGMKVMTFGFDSDETNPHYPGNYTANCVAYTGTHDNDTVLGWTEHTSPEALAFAQRVLGFTKKEEAPDAFIRALFRGPCDIVVVPMQDVLALGGYARMNYPGSIGGNWTWRMKPDQLSLDLSLKYYSLNKETDRR